MDNLTINTASIVSICSRFIRLFINVLYPALPDYQPWEVLNKSFSIHTETDWYILCSAMDLIEDTESAKENYILFGLAGPTKYNDNGEKYLRLYGLLNALYLQKDAIIALLKFCNLFDLKKEKEEIEKLQIMKLRNIAGSHTMNFKDYSDKTEEKKKYAYMLARYSLDCKNISVRNEEGVEEININEAFYEFNKVVGRKLYIAVNYLFNALKSKCKEEYNENKIVMEHIKNYVDGKIYTVLDQDGIWNVGDLDYNSDNIEIYGGKHG